MRISAPFRVIVALAAAALLAGPSLAQNLEQGVNRRGEDYRSFDLPVEDPGMCRDACNGEAQCRAFTYVRPGVQGPSPRCWLKYAAPPPSSDACCVSGVKGGPVAGEGFEYDTNRWGRDYRSFDLSSADPRLCRDACQAEGQCMAFSFVKPGVQGSSARCWLKSAVPPAASDGCCISGVKPGVSASGGVISIVEATYGGNCPLPRGNATGHIAGQCNGTTQCVYAVDHNVFGSPGAGCAKDYDVTWACSNGGTRNRHVPGEAGYGSRVELSC